MKLSLVTEIDKSSTDVVDTTEKLDNTVHRNYPANSELQYNGDIWQNVGETILIPVYDANATYNLGDLVYKDGLIQKATSQGIEMVPKQPWDYSAVDTSKNPNDWTERYVKITDSFSEGFAYTQGNNGFTYKHGTIRTDQLILTILNASTNEPVEPYWWYGGWEYPEISNETFESKAEVYGYDNYGFFTYFMNGTSLYARTHLDAEIEYDTTPGGVVFTPITNITELGTFAKVRPTMDNAPFDDKHYSKAKKQTSMTYTVNIGDSKFDTLGLGRVIADTVDVYFYDELDGGGTLIDSTIGYPINNSRDINSLLPDYDTTATVYSDTVVNKGGSIRFVLHGSFVSLGTIMCGLKVDAGFTNLQFSNSFIDHSPKNVDNWGNVEYIEGVKVMVFDGTVDLPITSYDMMNRLMLSIGGSTVILNGSDSVDNQPADSESIFASTMIIGRMSNFKLQTTLKNKRMNELATYSIKIVELT